jgi:hypothetical protein
MCANNPKMVQPLGPIRLFRADSMQWTPFSIHEPTNPILAAGGVVFVEEPSKADIITARRERLLPSFGDFDGGFAVWTHEPRYNFRREHVFNLFGVRNAIHVMNAYNGLIYADHFYYFVAQQLDFDKMLELFRKKPRRAVMLARYASAPTTVFIDGHDCDLLQFRQDVALHLQKRQLCDIYGKGWPSDVTVSGTSRQGDWRKAKREILQHYAINIAFENTSLRNYVTEKIWDAIVGGCLPVYYGSENGIYDIFPKNSFVEASGKSAEALTDQIVSMSKDEMEARYAACLRAYMNVCARDLRLISRQACLVRTVRFLDSVINFPLPVNSSSLAP